MSKDALGKKVVQNIGNYEEKILLMFTSTQEPYVKDVLDLLSYPSKMHYRFRYETKYLPFELLSENGLANLTNQEALIVHVDTQKQEIAGQEKYVVNEFIPIRKAKIAKAKLVGDFVWIDFTLENLVVYNSSAVEGELNPYHERIKGLLSVENQTELKKTAAIVQKPKIETISEDISNISDDVLSNWANLVSYISRLSAHKNSVFTKLLEIKDVDKNEKLGLECIAEDLNGFVLETEKTYQIKVLQRYHNKDLAGIPFNYEVLTNQDEIKTVKGVELIQGRYDLLRFIIKCESLAKTHHSFIQLQPKFNTGDRILMSTQFYNVKIKSKIAKTIAVLALLGSGIGFAGLAQQIATVSGVPEFSWALPVGGGIMSAIVVYFLPKS